MTSWLRTGVNDSLDNTLNIRNNEYITTDQEFDELHYIQSYLGLVTDNHQTALKWCFTLLLLSLSWGKIKYCQLTKSQTGER